MSTPDPTTTEPADLLESSRWRPLRLLLQAMDDEIAALYAEAGLAELRPRYVGPLIQLSRHDSMTIRELADSVEVTHSAMSQTVSGMRAAGLVQRVPGADGRTRRVALTDRARELLPFLEAEWRATEAAVIELEAELPYALSRVVRDMQDALANRPFGDRLRENLAAAREGRSG